MNDTSELRYLASTPSDARRFVRAALRRASESVIDTAELLTSEVVTNAFMHGRSSSAPIGVRIDGDVVRIEVDDPSPTAPTTVTKTDPMVPGGWGMGIVENFATRWGVEPHVGNGKTVWFELDPRLVAA